MAKFNIVFLIIGLCIFSCSPPPCYDIKFEVSGSTTSVDSLVYSIKGIAGSSPDLQYSIQNVSLPITYNHQFCGNDFDCFMRIFVPDTTQSYTIKIFVNNVLKDQSNQINLYYPNQYGVEVGMGIND